MKNIKISLVATLVVLSGCGDGDVAPYIEAASTSSCENINYYNSNHDMARALALVNAGLDKVSKEYTDDTEAQEFVRRAILNDGEYRNYTSRILSYCSGNPALGTNEALVDVMNSVISDSKSVLGVASCKSFNDGLFEAGGALAEIEANPDTYNMKDIGVVIKDARFGSEYFEREVSEFCEVNPYKHLVGAYRKAWISAGKVISDEIYAAKKVEEDKVKAEEAQQKQSTHLANIEKYGHDLYESNGATCDNLKIQYDLSFNDEIDRSPFEAAVMQTLRSIPLPALRHQELAFTQQLNSDPERLLSAIVSKCEGSASIEDAALNTHWVAEAESEVVSALAHERVGESTKALAKNCANLIPGSKPCFEAASDYITYDGYKQSVELANVKLAEAERRLNVAPPSDWELVNGPYGYADKCKKRLFDEGYRDSDLNAKIESQCPKEALVEFFMPVREEVKKIKLEGAEAQKKLDEMLVLSKEVPAT
ncbi:hypothetical protein B382_22425 [Stutzerimonas stutzeri B1SMN1]|nr:hypothetical protein B382_22425 [Stutzerimonas stutzeri B1SMN1]